MLSSLLALIESVGVFIFPRSLWSNALDPSQKRKVAIVRVEWMDAQGIRHADEFGPFRFKAFMNLVDNPWLDTAHVRGVWTQNFDTDQLSITGKVEWNV